MKQENSYRYSVDNGEKVSIDIKPMKGASGEKVLAALDGVTLENKSTSANPKFEFTVTRPSRERQFLIMSFSFVSSDPKDANFEIHFGGSNNGGFPGMTVRKKKGDHQEPQYTFKVN